MGAPQDAKIAVMLRWGQRLAETASHYRSMKRPTETFLHPKFTKKRPTPPGVGRPSLTRHTVMRVFHPKVVTWVARLRSYP